MVLTASLLMGLTALASAVRMTSLRPVLELALDVPLPNEPLDCAPCLLKVWLDD